MLIILSGLPGTGKTTIGKALAAKRSAAYVRVDEIEHALKQHFGFDQELGPAGYVVAYAIASSNLKLGNPVVAVSVNPVPESRQGWRDVAHAIDGGRLLEVEVICSDKKEHRRRVEGRAPDIKGFILPTWSSVTSHDYVPRTEPRLIVDTAHLSALDAVATIERRLDAMTKNCPSSP
ncbi:AAA family ATPase [Magnetospirillum sulfuroxidans]|uniref:AAA family ATPase n=1 Tax=Magnetospirillum sulfuroxidans TaxID=611300 RepID=A0ABS5IHB6_9PROT|nr:AAA family ATPase [Magnetospirillum sulfuroxidans]MBR9973148.1 AAA family ATPase [Magnetospirillum sulfuroxidans]